MTGDEALGLEMVRFGNDHVLGGQEVSWDAEKMVAVITNTKHHPDHHVQCRSGGNGKGHQQCLDCEWRNPTELMVHSTEYPVLYQRLYFGEVWDDELYLLDDYQPFDNPEVLWIFKQAFSGIDTAFGRAVARLNRGRFVSSGEEKTKWFKLDGSRWIPAELADIKELMNPQTALIHSKLEEAYKHYLAAGDENLARQILRVKRKAVHKSFINRVARMTLARYFTKGYKEVVEGLKDSPDGF
ncbi:hypothetical protein HK102_009107 [Quaeritorhiza haematococci]|nr:hypothetical protein HK102_009107 [Quaeritorhiza haematococci]